MPFLFLTRFPHQIAKNFDITLFNFVEDNDGLRQPIFSQSGVMKSCSQK